MIPYQVEISTAITIISIAAILSVYLLVLKRNGWIGKTSIEKSHTEKTVEEKPAIKIQQSAPTLTTIESKVAPPKEEIKQPETIKTEPLTVRKEDNKINKKSKTKKEVPEGCNHYFGYLWSLPKGTATPDECYLCFKLIDCYKETNET